MILHKKMLRDLLERKGANGGIILLIAIGIMVFTSFAMLDENMRNSTQRFYEQGHLSHGFLDLKGIPRSKMKGALDLPGIAKVQGRISIEAKVTFQGSENSVYLRLLSMENPLEDLNTFVLTKGRYPRAGKHEILLDQLFAKTNDLHPGSNVTLTLHGKQWHYTVSGIGASPEYVYALRSSGDLFPDYKTFGPAAMPLEDLAAISGMEGQYNSISFLLKEEAEFQEVKTSIQDALAPYGVTGVRSREDQVSWKMVDGELERLSVFGKILPVIFLGIAALVEFIMLERLVASQRTQIGILRAYGYTKQEILRHFIGYALILGLLGALLGGLLGLGIFYPLLDMFGEFFNYPVIYRQWYPSSFFYAGILSLFFSMAAGGKGALNAAKLQPVEALAPQAPHYQGKEGILRFALPLFDTWGWISLRNMARNKKRSFFLVVGVTVTCALGLLSMTMATITDDLIYSRYRYSELYHAKMVFSSPLEGRSPLLELEGKQGVSQGEALLEAPVTLYKGSLKKDMAILGISQDSQLYHVVDDKNKEVPLKGTGIILSKRGAQLLGVQIGDLLLMESPFSKKNKKIPIYVENIVEQNLGLSAYMRKDQLEHLLGRKDTATSLLFRVESPASLEKIREEYKESPKVASITSIQEFLRMAQELMGSYGSMVYIYALLSFLIGFVMVYNSYLVTVSERSRELASLLVLGMSRKEVAKIVALEQWLLSGVGIVLGCPLGVLLLFQMKKAIDTDFFAFPLRITGKSLWMGIGCTLFSVWIAQQRGKSKIKALSIVEVLKARE